MSLFCLPVSEGCSKRLFVNKGVNVSGGDSVHLSLSLLWSQDFPPVFTVMTFCVQSGLFQQHIQSVLLAIMPCLHHTITSAPREFHALESTRQCILDNWKAFKSASWHSSKIKYKGIWQAAFTGLCCKKGKNIH